MPAPLRLRRPLLFLLAALAAGGCGDSHAPPADLLEALRSAPGVVAVEDRSADFEVPTYFITFEQPVDHRAKSSRTFRQFVSLVLRDRKAPVLFGTNGYYASRRPGSSWLGDVLQANQVTVEHRFFDPSSPEPKDWSKLTLEQAAADHHRIVRALRPILTGRWISIGASKGGMTAVYHRKLYPGDVDGTIAYVAPQSYARVDPDYATFLRRVGEPWCRERLREYQRLMLERRAEVEGYMGCYWAGGGLVCGGTFDRFGRARLRPLGARVPVHLLAIRRRLRVGAGP